MFFINPVLPVRKRTQRSPVTLNGLHSCHEDGFKPEWALKLNGQLETFSQSGHFPSLETSELRRGLRRTSPPKSSLCPPSAPTLLCAHTPGLHSSSAHSVANAWRPPAHGFALSQATGWSYVPWELLPVLPLWECGALSTLSSSWNFLPWLARHWTTIPSSVYSFLARSMHAGYRARRRSKLKQADRDQVTRGPGQRQSSSKEHTNHQFRTGGSALKSLGL